MPIWTTDYLASLNVEAGDQISTDINCIYNRSMLATTQGLSTYTLPAMLRSLLKVTWRGLKVDPVNWEQFTSLTPNAVFLDLINRIEAPEGRPYWYTINPTNLFDIRFYPTPNESFTDTGDPFSPDNGPKCIVSYYQKIDTLYPTTVLPFYVDRRLRKVYVLWQAFLAEGKGQDLKAAEYYRNRYNFLIERFRAINEGCYISKRYSLGESEDHYSYRRPRPTLPTNYERRFY